MTLSLVIGNAGPDAVTGASFADTLPVGLGTITNVTSAVSGGASTATFSTTASALTGVVNLPSGGRATVTFWVSVAANAAGNITNVATVSAPGGVTDLNPANNTGSVTVAVASPDLTSMLRLPAGAEAGAVIGGTVTFGNIATDTMAFTATAVTGTVTLSNGTVKLFSVGDLAPGASSVHTFTTTMPTLAATTVLNGTSTVAATNADRNPANNTSTASALVQRADVRTTLTLPTSARRLALVAGTVVFTNGATGSSALAAAGVTGTVTLSNGNTFSYSLGTLAPGASVSRTFTFIAPSRSGTLTATSRVATTSVESNTANNMATGSMRIR